MTKLLFLDFDGVLHPNFSSRTEYFSRADCLIEVLEARATPLEVIVSSSWRFHYPFEELLNYLPQPLRQLVRGATPEVDPGRHQRYREILAYLGKYKGDPDWRALDDDLTGFPGKCRQLIACDGNVGVDAQSAGHLREWLES